MVRAEFKTWLAENATLSEPERRRAWQALALSRTADSHDIAARSPLDHSAPRFDWMAGEPPLSSPSPLGKPANRVGSASLADLGQRPVDSVGCPHYGNRDVAHWGQASTLPRSPELYEGFYLGRVVN
jgi:hypothetical protein